MDPLTLAAAGAVVGGSLLLKLVSPELQRRFGTPRARLREHRLVVLVDEHGRLAWTDEQPHHPPLFARIEGGGDVVVCCSSRIVTRTRFLWARRHTGLLADDMRQSPAFCCSVSCGDETLDGAVVARWREVATECFVGGMPRAAIDAVADDDGVVRALLALFREDGALHATPDQLELRFPRTVDAPEHDVRRALDISRGVVDACDIVASRLPEIDGEPLPVRDHTVSAQGSPFAVRSLLTP